MLDWLYSLKGRGSVLGLERVLELLEKLGNPQDKLKCVHIAGTNGKGSTCAILSSILTSAGYKTGMYTSPHLKSFNERIQIDGKEINDEELSRLVEQVKPLVTDQTFFEVTTAIAFLYFFENEVDYLVLEVGLGGRLDATNVIKPLVSVITNISLEHTHILGETEEKIAGEKAGIIKKGVPVVACASGKALEVIKKIAKEKGSEIFIPKKYRRTNGEFNVNSYKRLKLGLKGEFQMENASIALKTLDILKKDLDIDEDAIRKGLENAIWPGRMDLIDHVLLDCAHNTDAVQTLKKEILCIKKDYERIISVIGIMDDKDKEAMVKEIGSFSDYVIFTKPRIDRSADPFELLNYTDVRCEVVLSVRNALKRAKKLANVDDLVIVTGSIYTVGEA